MKVYVESKSFTDPKTKEVINYDEFSTRLDFPGFKSHKLVFKIEDKIAKNILSDNIDDADFGLKISTSKKTNEEYYIGIVHLEIGTKTYDIKAKLDSDQIMLLRLYLRNE